MTQVEKIKTAARKLDHSSPSYFATGMVSGRTAETKASPFTFQPASWMT